MTHPWTATRDDCVPGDFERLLHTLPEWFGRPESNAEYVLDASTMETWTVRDVDTSPGAPDARGPVVGAMLVNRRYPHAAEIHLIAVERSYRGRGVGRALVTALQRDARENGVRLLSVKTLGASDPDRAYAETRHFYERCGFLALEETAEWGEDTPCLVMVLPVGS